MLVALDVVLVGEVHLNHIVLLLHIGAVELVNESEYCAVLMNLMLYRGKNKQVKSLLWITCSNKAGCSYVEQKSNPGNLVQYGAYAYGVPCLK